MKNRVFIISLVWSTSLSAQPLHTFSNGEVADAEKINDNFQTLNESIPSALSDLEDDLGLSSCVLTPSPSARTALLTCGDISVLLPSFVDIDGDGYPEEITPIMDCGESSAAIYPNAPELEDGLDNDCNGIVDDGFGQDWFIDNDDDGFGEAGTSIKAASQPPGYVDNDLDCDDSNSAINPNAVELDDGVDNDCNGLVDDGLKTWFIDADGDGFGNPDIALSVLAVNQPAGYVADNNDCDDDSDTTYPGAEDIIGDGIDQDCDGVIDQGAVQWWPDRDADNFGDFFTEPLWAILQPSGHVDNNGDCNDYDDSVYVGAPEILDMKDNDCDGLVDEVDIIDE